MVAGAGAAPARSLGDALAALGSAQKPGGGVPAYTRWINRRAARIVAALGYVIGASADAVTIASAALSAAGLAVLILAPITVWSGVLAALLLALGYVFDSADGQLARLSRTGGPAGEWLDHVVDAIRTPAIHLAVLVALWRHSEIGSGWLWLPIVYTVLAVGQFMSQILAEQLARGLGADAGIPTRGGALRSIALLPTDMGALCWVFALWAWTPLFLAGYGLLLAVNLVHTAASMVRKHRRLRALSS
ncbi:CDP-alcohol phosphatidyltransferase [Schumannella soli]|uniref:CDP-alcohol phosphatidyltransferase n=1 Tax=Schumannella soli TaxID=2590779 RepID=A0A506XUY6_9MICO|nr:CDP-alcohol phosphatidyltransferase [Schumannella soli]